MLSRPILCGDQISLDWSKEINQQQFYLQKSFLFLTFCRSPQNLDYWLGRIGFNITIVLYVTSIDMEYGPHRAKMSCKTSSAVKSVSSFERCSLCFIILRFPVLNLSFGDFFLELRSGLASLGRLGTLVLVKQMLDLLDSD